MVYANYDTFIDSIRGYASPTIRAKLDAEVPRIKQEVRKSMVDFGLALSAFVAEKVETLSKDEQTKTTALREELEKIRRKLAKGTPPSAEKIDALAESLEAYEARLRALGENTKTIVLNALRSQGVPVPE